MWFEMEFITPEMREVFPAIIREYLAHEPMVGDAFHDVPYARMNEATWDDALNFRILAMMVIAARRGSTYSRNFLISLYKEYYYSLWVTMPADHDHVYLYDRPSSTKGMNLGRIDNGDLVYVYYLTNGLNGRESVWAYCDFNGIEGFIRYCNLTPEDGYMDSAC